MIALDDHMTRRTFILNVATAATAAAIAPRMLWAEAGAGETGAPIRRPIPSSGELLPVMGMGTSQTFDVGDDAEIRAQLAEVLQLFFDNGGMLIDTSPMYGRSEAVLGALLKSAGKREELFAATKVWTDGRDAGIAQMGESMQRIGVEVMDLMQIHNLRDWQAHLPVLKEWKAQGRFRYIGITTSHGRYHDQLEQLLGKEPFDFVQFSYNIVDREVEARLLPLAAERGIATLINRPFQRAELFGRVKGVPLPEWSAEFDCSSWGQYFIKFILGHPAVTCVIPATAKARHMRDNMQAGFGRLPDDAMRRRMRTHFESL
jgi:aryl-alcohol dehydrogenase-like predicted oxidoreductase